MVDPAALERLRQKVLAYDRHQAISTHFGSAEERDAWNAELDQVTGAILHAARAIFCPTTSAPVFGSQADADGAFEEYAYCCWAPGRVDWQKSREENWARWQAEREAFIADLKNKITGTLK